MQAYNGRDNRNNQVSLLQKIRNDDAHENGDPLNAVDSIKSPLDPSFLLRASTTALLSDWRSSRVAGRSQQHEKYATANPAQHV